MNALFVCGYILLAVVFSVAQMKVSIPKMNAVFTVYTVLGVGLSIFWVCMGEMWSIMAFVLLMMYAASYLVFVVVKREEEFYDDC